MSRARLVITAVTVEGRRPTEVATTYGVSRSWVHELLARYRTEGQAAFEPRSRRPRTSPTATGQATVDLIVTLRKQLTETGLDAGPATIAWHLAHHHETVVSASTIARVLSRQNLAGPEPRKRPKASYIRFAAELPNQCRQSDFTHYRLADGTDTEIITWLDDHSRYALHCTAHKVVTATTVFDTFTETAARQGFPASTLTDNGMVYTVRLAGQGRRGGRTKLEAELARRGITQKNARPNHPTTCGKVERFQQTLKKWLRAQPDQPTTLPQLQTLIETFRHTYNHHRPHRSLPHQATPATAYTTRPKATPTGARAADTHNRLRRDRIDNSGKLTLRVAGRLHHIGVGRTHARTHVLVLVHNHDIRVIHAATGELLRELVLDPTRDYQPTGRPRTPPPQNGRAEPPQ